MSVFLSFHHLASGRGDGLHPQLAELLEARDRRSASEPSLVDIAVARGDQLVRAGPFPAPSRPDSLPGNVVRLAPVLQAAATLEDMSNHR